jgi:hypothetical protein
LYVKLNASANWSHTALGSHRKGVVLSMMAVNFVSQSDRIYASEPQLLGAVLSLLATASMPRTSAAGVPYACERVKPGFWAPPHRAPSYPPRVTDAGV